MGRRTQTSELCNLLGNWAKRKHNSEQRYIISAEKFVSKTDIPSQVMHFGEYRIWQIILSSKAYSTQKKPLFKEGKKLGWWFV